MSFFMLRLFTIIITIWRFGLDDIVFAAINQPLTNGWRRLTAWRHRQPAAVRLRRALEHLGPIFVKFGQVLSTRRDLLPPDFAEELTKLQDQVPPASPAAIRQALMRAYDQPLNEIFSEFEEVPAGSASVAQVHRARLAASGAEVAVKILRPGIEQLIRRDLRLLHGFAVLAERLLPDGRRLKPRGIIEQFARHLQAETRLLREAANCTQLKKNNRGMARLRIPDVHWRWCNEQVMVMDFLAGVPLSRLDQLGASIDRSTLARTGIDLLFTQVFRDNFFHADMHPGNVHVDSAGNFILLDYGIVGQLTDFDKEYLLRNFLAFFNRDYRAVAEMHVRAGWVPRTVDVQEFEAELRAVCEPIFAQPLRNISFGKFLLTLFQTARRFHLEVQPQLILLQKTLLNVEGMGRELDPDINMWDTAKPVLEHWARDEQRPRRVLALLKKQTPDWLALLKDTPPLLRQLTEEQQQRRQRQPEEEALKWRLNRWRWCATILLLALIVSLSRYLPLTWPFS